MRIDNAVTQTGEMFQTAQDTAGPGDLDRGFDKTGDRIRVSAETTSLEAVVIRLQKDIGHRGQVDLDDRVPGPDSGFVRRAPGFRPASGAAQIPVFPR